MADTKITALPTVTSLDGTEKMAAVQGGNSSQATVQQVRNALYNQNTTTQALTAATLTYLAGSSIAIPTGKIRIGTRFRWRLQLSKTAAGVATSQFFIKIGTAGTTADATVFTFTTLTPTAVVDQGFVDIEMICLGPLSSSGLFHANFFMSHGLATTGLMNLATQTVASTSSTFDVTTANLIVGLACTTGAASVWTFQMVAAEAYNL